MSTDTQANIHVEFPKDWLDLQPASECASVDALGLYCPMPIVKLGQELRKLGKGAVVLLKATDAGTGPDLAKWVGPWGHSVLGARIVEGTPVEYWFWVQSG